MGYCLVFIGSGLGGMLRYAVGMVSLRLFGPAFPVGTLAINIAGSALMGLVIAMFAAFPIGGHDSRLFLTTGVIGGFTTFSTFSLDAVTLWERGEYGAATFYVMASVILSLLALVAAMHLGRKLG